MIHIKMIFLIATLCCGNIFGSTTSSDAGIQVQTITINGESSGMIKIRARELNLNKGDQDISYDTKTNLSFKKGTLTYIITPQIVAEILNATKEEKCIVIKPQDSEKLEDRVVLIFEMVGQTIKLRDSNGFYRNDQSVKSSISARKTATNTLNDYFSGTVERGTGSVYDVIKSYRTDDSRVTRIGQTLSRSPTKTVEMTAKIDEVVACQIRYAIDAANKSSERTFAVVAEGADGNKYKLFLGVNGNKDRNRLFIANENPEKIEEQNLNKAVSGFVISKQNYSI